MKAFISGPMTDIEDFNRPRFNDTESKLIRLGFSVFNPSWLLVDKEWTHEDVMPVDLAALSRCDILVQLEGWENSKGAKKEYDYAVANRISIITEDVLDEILLATTITPDKILEILRRSET